jgi:hypothetical protein
VKHPQLDSVEVGGVDPRIGLWNPPEAELPKLCRGQVDVMLRLASMAPRVRIVCLGITHLSGDIWQASVLLENVGYLPSHVLDSARSGPLGDPPRLEIIEQGCQLENPNRQLLMEHLAGWGGGLYNLAGSLLSLKSKGGASKHHLTLTVRGHGSLLLRLTSPRLGLVETTLSAPDEAAEHAASR